MSTAGPGRHETERFGNDGFETEPLEAQPTYRFEHDYVEAEWYEAGAYEDQQPGAGGPATERSETQPTEWFGDRPAEWSEGQPAEWVEDQPTERFQGQPLQTHRFAQQPPAAAGRSGAPRETLRFGPGVTATSTPPAWPAVGRAAGRRRRRWLRVALSSLLTLALAAAVIGYLWWSRQDPLAVTGVTVAPAEAPGDRCNVTVDVVGTVQTNGNPGTITYQWIRSDGETSAVLNETVADGATSSQVHLFWSFSGEGTYQATATLRILEPDSSEASAEFTYQCE